MVFLAPRVDAPPLLQKIARTETAMGIYSAMADNQVSLHFKESEFACKCGCGLSSPDPKLVDVLEHIRSLSMGKNLRIVSGRRCPARNAKVGGAPKSQHLKGTAADIQIPGLSPARVAALADIALRGSGGIGTYNTFTHVDVRKARSRWGK